MPLEMYREQYGEFAYWGVFKGYQPLQQGLNLTTKNNIIQPARPRCYVGELNRGS